MSLKTALDKAQGVRPARVLQRYLGASGNLLAAGVAFYAFFSIFPAVALAVTIFGFVLRGRPELVEAIVDYLNQLIPGLVRTADNPDGLISATPPESNALTIAGVIAIGALVFAGLGWIGALRTGIRRIFGLEGTLGNPVVTKLHDLGMLIVLGLGIAISAVLTSVLGGLSTQLAQWVGLGENTALLTVLGLTVSVALDTFLMVLLLRLLSGVKLPIRRTMNGALLGAVLLTAMKYFGGVLIERSTANPLLGAVAVAVGLLVWLNFMSRVVLLAAAWAADDIDVPAYLERTSEAESHDAELVPLAVVDPMVSHEVDVPAQLPPVAPAPVADDSGAPVRTAFVAGAITGAAVGALMGSRERRTARSKRSV